MKTLLYTELEKTAINKESLHTEMTELSKRIAEDEQLYSNYQAKMTSHEKLVAEQEQDRPLRVELRLLQEAVQRLESRGKRNTLL